MFSFTSAVAVKNAFMESNYCAYESYKIEPDNTPLREGSMRLLLFVIKLTENGETMYDCNFSSLLTICYT